MRIFFPVFILFVVSSLCKGDTTPISQAEISTLLHHRDILFQSNTEIEDLFSQEAKKFYSGIRKGFFDLGSGDILDPKSINLVSSFQLTFHQDHFGKFRNGMIQIFNRVSLDKFSLPRGKSQEELLRRLEERAQKKSWPEGCMAAGFEDSNSSNMLFYALPAAVYRKLVSLCQPQTVLVFNFNLSDGKTLKRYLRCSIASFYFIQRRNSFFKTVIFQNKMKFNSSEMNTDWTEKAELKTRWNFSESEIRKMQECKIDFFQGSEADYVWNRSVLNDYNRVRQDALNGNPIAMIDMTEYFNRPKSWYHVAALMGEKKAQKKLQWENGGFGFGIRKINEQLVIWKPHPISPLRKGKILLSVDGVPVKHLVNLSQLIGKIPPGENVCLEFADGEKVFCKLLPKP